LEHIVAVTTSDAGFYSVFLFFHWINSVIWAIHLTSKLNGLNNRSLSCFSFNGMLSSIEATLVNSRSAVIIRRFSFFPFINILKVAFLNTFLIIIGDHISISLLISNFVLNGPFKFVIVLIGIIFLDIRNPWLAQSLRESNLNLTIGNNTLSQTHNCSRLIFICHFTWFRLHLV
jgi:hypothetical protein